MKLWDLSSGRVLRTFNGHTASVGGSALSGDGRFAVSCSYQDKIRYWDVAGGKQIRIVGAESALAASIKFSPDGSQVLSNTENELKLYDVATGRKIRTFRG